MKEQLEERIKLLQTQEQELINNLDKLDQQNVKLQNLRNTNSQQLISLRGGLLELKNILINSNKDNNINNKDNKDKQTEST